MKQNILKAAILAAGFCCTVGCSDNDSDLTIYIPDAGTARKPISTLKTSRMCRLLMWPLLPKPIRN